jgi:tripartite-type tricarboxylate transporter receptor subunit TctC
MPRRRKKMLASLFSNMRALLPAALTSAIALYCNATSANAETFPSRPVRVVVAAPPGGLTDVVARSVSQFLQEKLGQPFIVENIAGASSTIGAMQVARSAPDGYTLLVNPSLFVITPMLMNVPYDVVRDFTPISNFGTVPIALGINPAVPAKTLNEFIALAKASPDKMTWGAEGVGSVGHLTMERLQREAGFKILIVHYKGTSPALLDLIAGRVSAMISPVPNMIEQFRGGAVRPVAVATKARVSALPDVPTIEEQGFPNFEIGSWYGLWGPANLPKDVVSVLNDAIAEAMKTPRVTERVAAQGLIPVGSSSADFAAFRSAEIAKFSKMIKDADIKIGN